MSSVLHSPDSGPRCGRQVSSRALLLVALMFGIAGLSACKSSAKVADCSNKKSMYLRAQDHAILQIPDGVESPDRRNALAVPPAQGNVDNKVTCLDRAPSYFGTAGRIAASPEETVADWAQAWADRNVDAVLAMYSSHFGGDAPGGDGAALLAQRRAEVANGPAVSGRVKNLKVTASGDDRRIVHFTQQFGTHAVQKELTLIRESGVWKIANEQVLSSS